MKKNSTNPLKGMLDWHPHLKKEENYIIYKIKQIALKNNFIEYDSPILEPIEVFQAKSSNEILEQQSYTFTDKGKRELILKPEITPVLARLVANYYDQYFFPLQWYTIGSCFRYENPQKGRLREFKQVNFDIVGKKHYLYDIKIIKVVRELISIFKVKETDYQIFYNHRGIVESILNLYLFCEKEKKNFYYLVDKKKKLDQIEFDELLKTNFSDKKKVTMIKKYLSIYNPQELFTAFPIAKDKNFFHFLKLIQSEKISYSPEIVRGFDYYTGMVFEVFSTDRDIKRSLFGGGRYDKLIGHYSDQEVSGVGFGLGLYIFSLFLKKLNLIDPDSLTVTIDYYIAPLLEEALEFCFEVEKRIQNEKKSAIIEIGLPDSLKKHFKKTDKMKIKNVIFIGEDELKSRNFRIKKINEKK